MSDIINDLDQHNREIVYLDKRVKELEAALREIITIATSKKAGAAARMQHAARTALTSAVREKEQALWTDEIAHRNALEDADDVGKLK